MKKQRAVRSASETQLRAKATSHIGQGAKKSRLVRTITVARVARALDKSLSSKGDKPSKTKKSKYVKSEQMPPKSRSESSTASGRQFVRSERVQKAVSGGKRTPAALPAPKSGPKPSSKKPRRSKKEETPGIQRVFKATPVVKLDEGPDFGKITTQIEPTFQPKQSRKKKDA